MPAGRPTNYDKDTWLAHLKDYAEHYSPYEKGENGKPVPNSIPCKLDIVEYLQGKGVAINRVTFWKWEEIHPEFASAVKKTIDSLYSENLQRAAMVGAWNTTFAIFSAKNRMGWTDRQEIDHNFHEPILIKSSDGKLVETLKNG